MGVHIIQGSDFWLLNNNRCNLFKYRAPTCDRLILLGHPAAGTPQCCRVLASDWSGGVTAL